jgi:hypothetical protein
VSRLVKIEAGQTWTDKADGSVVIVEGRSDLLVRWWKVRSVVTGLCRSIDEGTLRDTHRLAQVDLQASPARGAAA